MSQFLLNNFVFQLLLFFPKFSKLLLNTCLNFRVHDIHLLPETQKTQEIFLRILKFDNSGQNHSFEFICPDQWIWNDVKFVNKILDSRF